MTKDETGANEAILLCMCVCVCVCVYVRVGGKEGGCSGTALNDAP